MNGSAARKRASALVLALVMSMLLLPSTALASGGLSGAGVQPGSHPGNFVAADDDQVCFELGRLIPNFTVTEDMRGFKIDPPTSFENDAVVVTLSADGKYLDWATKPGVTMVAVIVKGGTNFHLYDYISLATRHTSDTGLHSPRHKRNVPQISHYNVCYIPPRGTEGCTPGYWRNHADRWLGASPADDFDGTFGVDAFNPNITLGHAIWATGGGLNALARHATAALLNSYGGVANVDDGATVSYPLTTAEVIAKVQAALAEGGDIEGTKDLFDAYNNLGCPLSGTRANPVPQP